MPIAPLTLLLAKQPESYARRKEYKIGRVLGQGTFGIVRHALWRTHGRQPVAIKIVPKKILRGNLHLIESETAVVKQLSDHPNIVRLYDHFESKDKFYLVFEPAMGGEVFDRVLRTGHLTEAGAAYVVHSVASALHCLHSHGFVHRDIKPENIMYLTDPDRDPAPRIVLVDFGVAQHLNSQGEKLRELAGSLGYAAPEVVDRQPYGCEVDMWSLGAVAFVMLSGCMPYTQKSPDELLEEMRAGPVQFTGKSWSDISDTAKDFIRQCMNLDIQQRLTAEQALQHPWVISNYTTAPACDTDGLPNIANALQDGYPRIKTRIPTALPARPELLSTDDYDDDETFTTAHFSDADKSSSPSPAPARPPSKVIDSTTSAPTADHDDTDDATPHANGTHAASDCASANESAIPATDPAAALPTPGSGPDTPSPAQPEPTTAPAQPGTLIECVPALDARTTDPEDAHSDRPSRSPSPSPELASTAPLPSPAPPGLSSAPGPKGATGVTSATGASGAEERYLSHARSIVGGLRKMFSYAPLPASKPKAKASA